MWALHPLPLSVSALGARAVAAESMTIPSHRHPHSARPAPTLTPDNGLGELPLLPVLGPVPSATPTSASPLPCQRLSEPSTPGPQQQLRGSTSGGSWLNLRGAAGLSKEGCPIQGIHDLMGTQAGCVPCTPFICSVMAHLSRKLVGYTVLPTTEPSLCGDAGAAGREEFGGRN